MLNRRPFGFRKRIDKCVNGMRKVNRRPLGFRMLNRHSFGFKIRKRKCVDNQRDMNRQKMPIRHLFGFKVHKCENVSRGINQQFTRKYQRCVSELRV